MSKIVEVSNGQWHVTVKCNTIKLFLERKIGNFLPGFVLHGGTLLAMMERSPAWAEGDNMPTDKRARTFRLSEQAWRLLDALSQHHGVPLTAIMEIAIRRTARMDIPLVVERMEAEMVEPATKTRKRRRK